MTIDKKREIIEEAFNYYHDRTSLTNKEEKELLNLVNELYVAISVKRCCTQLLCISDDFNFLTKNKSYKMVSEPDGHYVVIDDFGEERLLWKKYFKILK